MSVIVGRALPDVRDGLKPVHRRVLFAMHELGNTFNKPYKKCARIVGEVLGKYHPHGDTAVYDAMVRMAQPWSMRYMLVDGQGNYGSQDGDGPAAMRYTEARLQKVAESMLDDLDKETVDFSLNFDDSLQEPTVLPSRIPQLLVNGSSGIAVGMATNMMPHNLSEVIDGCIAYIDNKEVTIDELMKHVKAPDFPTRGIIYGIEGIKQAMHTGRGRVVLRGKVNVETLKSGKEQIVITEVPYQVSRDALAEKIGYLVNNKQIEGITHVANESNKEGTRIVIELRRDAVAQVIINQLYKFSELETSYGINNVALVNGRPRTLNLKDLVSEFVIFRHEVVVRRTQFELREAEKRAHILEGYLIALDHLDEVITLIRNSANPDMVVGQLTARRGHVLLLQRPGDIGDRGAGRDQLGGVDPDPHRAVEVAQHLDLTDPVDQLKRVPQLVARDVGEQLARERSGHADGEDRRVVGVTLRHRRGLHAKRQQALDLRDPRLDVLQRELDVAIDIERRDDAREVAPRLRRDLDDATHLREHVLDRVDEAGLDVLGRCAGPRNADGHGRVVDVGKLADPDPRHRDDADQDGAEHQHPREHRTPETEVGDVQAAPSGRCASSERRSAIASRGVMAAPLRPDRAPSPGIARGTRWPPRTGRSRS